MPWCPKCKYEYREGVKKCSDCNIELVEVLSEEDYIDENEEKERREFLDELKKESYFYAIHTKTFGSDILYKIFFKNNYLYCSRIASEILLFYHGNDRDGYYNSYNIEDVDFLSLDKKNKKLDTRYIENISFNNKMSNKVPVFNYGEMRIVFKDNSLMKFVLILNDIDTVKEILHLN